MYIYTHNTQTVEDIYVLAKNTRIRKMVGNMLPLLYSFSEGSNVIDFITKLGDRKCLLIGRGERRGSVIICIFNRFSNINIVYKRAFK